MLLLGHQVNIVREFEAYPSINKLESGRQTTLNLRRRSSCTGELYSGVLTWNGLCKGSSLFGSYSAVTCICGNSPWMSTDASK